MKRITRALAATAIILMALTACGTVMQDNNGTSNAGCIDLGTTGSGYHVYDCQIALRDTRRVNCFVVSATGVDCDWSHVDEGDNR